MSCRTTAGGSASLSIARIVSGLPEKDVQHLFHALKREGEGQPRPSEYAIREWRARQEEMLDTNTRIPDARKDSLRTRLFRSREQEVPDGAMFYAWSRIEHRARQEAAIRSITNAVDLDPPGSHADRYTLGEDGRPTHVMYASYGSNLHRDRFMTYIEGGSPEGSRRVYPGCTDPSEPEVDIPIRYHGGYRAHFALTSSVWHGGIAFMDRTEDDEDATALGRAYKLPIGTFDEVVHFENGGFSTSSARPVPLDGVLAKGRHETGPGAYETMMHIGDYDGMPVLTFTAPFTAHEALTAKGRINRNKVSLPVRTNKPSAAYCRMIGNGLQETFGMTEVQAADYLRGMPGGDRYSRRDMVAILRNKDEDRPSGWEKTSVGYTPAADRQPTLPAFTAPAAGPTMTSADLKAWMEQTHAANGAARRGIGGTADPRTSTNGAARPNPAYDTPLPPVKQYATIEEQETGVRHWTTRRDQWATNVAQNEATLTRKNLSKAERAKVEQRLASARARLAESEAGLAEASAQKVTNYFSPTSNYAAKDWKRIATRERQIADHARKRALAAQNSGDEHTDRAIDEWTRAEDKAREAETKRDEAIAAEQTLIEKRRAHTRRNGKGKGKGRSRGTSKTEPWAQGVPGVRTYRSKSEQDAGISAWEGRLETARRNLAQMEADTTRDPNRAALEGQRKRVALIEERLGKAKAQTPPLKGRPATDAPKPAPSGNVSPSRATNSQLREHAHAEVRLPNVKRYRTAAEQEQGIRSWANAVDREVVWLNNMKAAGLDSAAITAQQARIDAVGERMREAMAQTPTPASPSEASPARGRRQRRASTPAAAPLTKREKQELRDWAHSSERIPAVKRYRSTAEQDAGVRRWREALKSEQRRLDAMSDAGMDPADIAAQTARRDVMQDRLTTAMTQTPTAAAAPKPAPPKVTRSPRGARTTPSPAQNAINAARVEQRILTRDLEEAKTHGHPAAAATYQSLLDDNKARLAALEDSTERAG